MKIENFPHWLTKTMVRGVKGFNLDAYLVALEGWRRGLTLTWYSDPAKVTDLKIIGFYPLGKTFSLRSEDQTHFFYRSRGDYVANQAVDIVSNKQETKKLLTQAGVTNPGGNRFDAETDDETIVQFAKDLGFPVVLKPTFGSLGKGVVINIQDEDDFRNSLHYVRCELGYQDVIVERFLEGVDVRIYVLGDNVLAATKRIPANVIGNGKSSIKQLIHEKNELRKRNPYLSAKSKQIHIDQELQTYIAKQNYTLDSIPSNNERVYLKGQSNISAGGDPIDVTDELTPEIKAVAINAVQAIPGLHQGGVDVLIHDNEARVIEINATADISMHIFPLEGKPRHVPEKIIDHYFPHTTGRSEQHAKLYFDYMEVRNLLRKKSTQEMTLTDAPANKLVAKRYVISGKVQKVGFRNWIRKKALEQEMHGYTRNLRNGNVVVVVANEDGQLVDDFKQICYHGPEKAVVKDVREYTWDNQIKLGFEIRETNRPSRKQLEAKLSTLQSRYQQKRTQLQQTQEKYEQIQSQSNALQNQLQQMKANVQNLTLQLDHSERERDRVQKEYDKVINSRIWRYTSLWRRIGRACKRFVRNMRGQQK
ncbi:MAG TPA: acylphosphatase [Bacillota bacterium]|nr:acylphosphatase [Bacillota bacterium]